MFLLRSEKIWDKSRMRLPQLYTVLQDTNSETQLTNLCSLSLLFHQPYLVRPCQTSNSWQRLYFCRSPPRGFQNVTIETLALSRFKATVQSKYSTSNLNFDNSILFYLANFLFYSILFCIFYSVSYSILLYNSLLCSILYSIL